MENEHFFLGLAAESGQAALNHRLPPDRAGRLGLLVERFDRVVVLEGPLRRLAQEDARQVLGRYPAAKYRLTFSRGWPPAWPPRSRWSADHGPWPCALAAGGSTPPSASVSPSER